MGGPRAVGPLTSRLGPHAAQGRQGSWASGLPRLSQLLPPLVASREKALSAGAGRTPTAGVVGRGRRWPQALAAIQAHRLLLPRGLGRERCGMPGSRRIRTAYGLRATAAAAASACTYTSNCTSSCAASLRATRDEPPSKGNLPPGALPPRAIARRVSAHSDAKSHGVDRNAHRPQPRVSPCTFTQSPVPRRQVTMLREEAPATLRVRWRTSCFAASAAA